MLCQLSVATCCWYLSGCSRIQDLCFVTYSACYPAGRYVTAAVLTIPTTDLFFPVALQHKAGCMLWYEHKAFEQSVPI